MLGARPAFNYHTYTYNVNILSLRKGEGDVPAPVLFVGEAGRVVGERARSSVLVALPALGGIGRLSRRGDEALWIWERSGCPGWNPWGFWSMFLVQRVADWECDCG